MVERQRVGVPRGKGGGSRRADAGLPHGTFEREMGKEGFFGPTTHRYHTRPPAGWVDRDRDVHGRTTSIELEAEA